MYLEVPKSDNLQVRSISREGDLAWLAGIIDGEGNIQPTVQNKKCGSDGTRRDYFEPKLRVTNTDVRMIKKISEIYVREGIVFFYSVANIKAYKNKKDTWHNQMEISVSSKGSTARLICMVLPYLVNKQRYAELMLDAIEWVQAQPRRGRYSEGVNYTTLPEFGVLISRMDEERKNLIEPSTTTRRAGHVLTWPGDIA